jgi:hypothetical protein
MPELPGEEFVKVLTQSMSPIPTKDELREKYAITEADFHVLTQSELPTPDSLLKEGAYLHKVGFWDQSEVWLKKTIVG